MIWIQAYVTSGFSEQGSIAPIAIFRVLFGVICLIKFLVETKRGYFGYFGKRTYLYFCYRMSDPKIKINETVFRVVYVLKFVAACAVVAGVVVFPSLIILSIAFLLEARVYFKFHTCLFFLVASLLCVSPCAGALTLPRLLAPQSSKWWIAQGLHKSGDLLAQTLLVATLSILYISTAIRKMNRAFLSGLVVYQNLQYVLQEKFRRKYWDGFYPSWFVSRLVNQYENRLRKFWAPLMVTTVGLELIVPVLLLTEKLSIFGVAIGLLMHAGMTLLYPLTLLHFTLLTVSMYLLFFNPDHVACVLMKLV